MTRRKGLAICLTVVLLAAGAAGVILLARQAFFKSQTITAFFTSATGIYPGDDVRVSGVKVGTITSITAEGTQAKVVLAVDHDLPIPADAKAVIVSQNLVASRYVQLAPAYRTSGPTMNDGAVIPLERTAVPVEWDAVKDQLMRLATDLGPKNGVSGTSVSRFIDSAANAMDGNGDKLRATLAQLAGVGRVLAEGGGNLVDIIKNLQAFVTALRDSGQQMVLFENRLASLTSVVDSSGSDLDASIKDLSVAVGEVRRFVGGNRDQTAELVQRLANITQNLVDHHIDVENILHAAPNSFANGYNIYNPDTGGPIGAFAIPNLSNPLQLICGAIGGIENTTAPETAKLCTQYLGPVARLLNFNYLPNPTNPYLAPSADPQNIVYADPALAPGGAGTPAGPPDMPPAVSSYTGFPDNPFPMPAAVPPPFSPGPSAPDHLPAGPSPALYPGAPAPAGPQLPAVPPSSVGDLLLPSDTQAPPPPPDGSANRQTPQAGGTPPS